MRNQEEGTNLLHCAAELRKVAEGLEKAAWNKLAELPDDILKDFRWEVRRYDCRWYITGYADTSRGWSFVKKVESLEKVNSNSPFFQRMGDSLKEMGGEKLTYDRTNHILVWKWLSSAEFRDLLLKYPGLDLDNLDSEMKQLESEIVRADDMRPLLHSLKLRQRGAVAYESVDWGRVRSGEIEAPKCVDLGAVMCAKRPRLVEDDWIYAGDIEWGFDHPSSISLDKAVAYASTRPLYTAIYRYIGEQLAEYVQGLNNSKLKETVSD